MRLSPSRLFKSLLVLAVGIGIGVLGHHFWIKTSGKNSTGMEKPNALAVYSVPDADFTEEAKRSPGISASVRLRGLVDANGRMANVRTFPMLPYNVPESAAGSGEFADVTSSMVNSRFVEQLPYGLTDAAIRQAQGIQFIPERENGEVPETVNVIVSFGFDGIRFPSGCDSIKVTIFNQSGMLWEGQTSVHRYKGCLLH